MNATHVLPIYIFMNATHVLPIETIRKEVSRLPREHRLRVAQGRVF